MDLDINLFKMLLRLKTIEIEKVEMGIKSIHVYCKMEEVRAKECPKCKNVVSQKRPKYRREIRDLDISGRQVFLHLQVHQYTCECGRTFSEQFDFVSSGKSYTKRQVRYIPIAIGIEMSAKQSHLQVGSIADMCHKTVERICYEVIETRLSAINWSKIFRIGIDEFAFKKGHKVPIAIGIVVPLINLDTGEIIEILEKRNKAFLRAYFQSLGSKFLNQVKEFCSDRWSPFQDLAKELFPNALIHIDSPDSYWDYWTMHLNKALDSYRKCLRQQDKEEAMFKSLIPIAIGRKLIKRPKNLKETELEYLTKVLKKDKTLKQLYDFRNEF